MRSFAAFTLFTLFSLPIGSVSAEIYHYIDSSGTMHFTNVPTDPRFKRLKPEKSGAVTPRKMDPDILEALIMQASEAQQLSPALIKAVIRAESGFDPMALSSSGAQGLMQLMPATAGDLNLEDPFDPKENIHGGTRYLRYLLDRFDQDLRLAIAAYHAGPGTVSKHGGVPPIEKTKNYIKTVLRFFEFYLGEAEQKIARNQSGLTTKQERAMLAQSTAPVQ